MPNSANWDRMVQPAWIALVGVVLMVLCESLSPVSATTPSTLSQAQRDCDAGDTQACTSVGLILSDPDGDGQDVFLSLRYLQRGCRAKDATACGRLALIYFDGAGDVAADRATAGRFAMDACAVQDRTGCEVAEAIFADAASDRFDAEKALRYRRANCDFGTWRSCEDLARIYYNLEEFAPAEQVATKACDPTQAERKSVCAFARGLRDRRIRLEQAIAQQQAQQRQRLAERERASAVVQSYIRQGQYDSAVYAAIYHSRSLDDATAALEATLRAGAIGSLYKDHLYVLDYWFPTGPLNRAVNAEIARRSSPDDCGIYNCTNMPGASTRRWAAMGGGRNVSTSRPSSSPSSMQPRMKSAADISRETRNRYRTAHCTMNNNANRYLCN